VTAAPRDGAPAWQERSRAWSCTPYFWLLASPGPSMRMDAVIGGSPESRAYELAAETTRSLSGIEAMLGRFGGLVLDAAGQFPAV
jgi:hypothetical protein